MISRMDKQCVFRKPAFRLHSQQYGYSPSLFLSSRVQSTQMCPPGVIIAPQGGFMDPIVGQQGKSLIPTIMKGKKTVP